MSEGLQEASPLLSQRVAATRGWARTESTAIAIAIAVAMAVADVGWMRRICYGSRSLWVLLLLLGDGEFFLQSYQIMLWP